MTSHSQMYCVECLREIPLDAPRFYAVEDQAKVYACCSELCASGSEHADPVDDTPIADGGELRNGMMESKLSELANATPEFTEALLASCKTRIVFTNPTRRGRAVGAALRGPNGRIRRYLSERRLYREQVECYWRERLAAEQVERYWRQRLPEAPMAKMADRARARAEEYAALRVEAERTRYRVSTWGWPYTWCLRFDRAWSRIEPAPSEPTEPMDAFERACAYRRQGATLLKGAQMRDPLWPSVVALILSAWALEAVRRSGAPWYVFVIACCVVGLVWHVPNRRRAAAIERERVRQIAAEIALENRVGRGDDLCAWGGGSEPKTTIDLYRMLEEQAKSNDRSN